MRSKKLPVIAGQHARDLAFAWRADSYSLAESELNRWISSSDLTGVVTGGGYRSGTSIRVTSTGNAPGAYFGVRQPLTGTVNSLLVLGAPNDGSAGVPRRAFFSQRYASNLKQINVAGNFDSNFSTNAGYLSYQAYDGSVRGFDATNQTDGKLHCWVLSRGTGTSAAMHRDGKKQTLQNTNTAANCTDSNQKLLIGNIADLSAADYNNIFSDDLLLVVAWNRYIEDGEASTLSADPLRLFDAPRKIYQWHIISAPQIIALAQSNEQDSAQAFTAIRGRELSMAQTQESAGVITPLQPHGNGMLLMF